MYKLSEPVHKLQNELAAGTVPPIDVVIVGSGYGGAVAAARFAEAGQRVLLLERGREYVAGEFPSNLSQTLPHLRIEFNNRDLPWGYEDALFDFRVGDETATLLGNALGGGSQVNANVALEPPPEAWSASPWPAAIRTAVNDGSMATYFARVRKTIGITSLPFDEAERLYKKSAALGRMVATAADPMGAKQQRLHKLPKTPLAVKFKGLPYDVDQPEGVMQRKDCTGCGNCVTGCNYDSKGTLTTNYLPLARASGARIVTGAMVLAVEQRDGGWRVHCLPTEYRSRLREWEMLKVNGVVNGPWNADSRCAELAAQFFTIHAPRVVIAAGTLGSAEILSRSQRGANPLALSMQFGVGFSLNGDHLAFSFGETKEVRAFGWAAAGDEKVEVGPTITATLESQDRKFIVQDAAIPGPIIAAVHEGLACVNALHGTQNIFDPVSTSIAGATHTQAFLCIGRDGAAGKILTDPVTGRVRVSAPGMKAANSPYDAYIACIDTQLDKPSAAAGGSYMSSPTWKLLPDFIQAEVGDRVVRGVAFVAHPLGGCRMSDNISEGVVDACGRVYRAGGAQLTYPGLYVLDGSILHGAVGVNPYLTIAAIAERAVEHIILDEHIVPAPPPVVAPAPAMAMPAPTLLPRRAIELSLAEVLRGSVRVNNTLRASVFHITFKIGDMDTWLHDLGQPFSITPESTLRIADPDSAVDLKYVVTSGTVQVLAMGTPFEALPLPKQRAKSWKRWACLRTRFGPVIATVIAISGKFSWLRHNLYEDRRIKYEFDLTFASGVPPAGVPRNIHATGIKVISYLRDEYDTDTDKPIYQENLLRMLITPHMTLRDKAAAAGAAPMADGFFEMDLADTLHHNLPQIHSGDTTHGLTKLLAYPLVFMRFMLRSLILDLRVPDYECDAGLKMAHSTQVVPVGGASLNLIKPTHYLPSLRSNGARVKPELHALRGLFDGAGAPLTLALWRYRRPGTIQVKPGIKPGTGVCKTVLLLHAFGQSALAFADASLDQSLAAAYLERGYDVWLLEDRISTALDGTTRAWDPINSYVEPCRRPSTMDEIAAADIPRAVDYMLDLLKFETKLVEPTFFAFAQCVGAASLAMSILGGRLSIPTAQDDPKPKSKPKSKLAGVFLSQFTPFSIGDPGSQARTSVPAFLRDVLRMSGVNFSTVDSDREFREQAAFNEGAVTSNESGVTSVAALYGKMAPADANAYQSSLTDTLLDLYAGIYPPLPPPDDEVHHGERRATPIILCTQAEVTCRRIMAIEAPLFRQSNLSLATFRRMPILFGHANISLFDHARRCVEYERLVDADGRNIYVTQDNIQTYLTMPLGLLHGEENKLFNIESSRRSADMIGSLRADSGNVDPVTQRTDYTNGRTLRTVFVKNMGHLDCIIGKGAPAVFAKMIDFFDQVFSNPAPTPALASQPTFRLQLPLEGPILGWTRIDGNKIVARLFARADNSKSDPAIALLLSYVATDNTRAIFFLSPRQLEDANGRDFTYFAGDIEIESDQFPGALQIEALTLHKTLTDSPYRLDDVLKFNVSFFLSSLQLENASPDLVRAATVATLRVAQRVEKSAFFRTFDYDKLRTLLVDRINEDRKRLYAADPANHSFELRQDRDIDEAQLCLKLPPDANTPTKLVIGTCRYPGFDFESERVDTLSFGKIVKKHCDAAAMILVGDQIYADATASLFDRMTSVERFAERYHALLRAPHFAHAVRRIPTYMTPDDHEFRNAWMKVDEALAPTLFKAATTTLQAYQLTHSPHEPVIRDPAIYNAPYDYDFRVGNIVVYVMDTISNRLCDPAPGKEKMVTDSQMEAFFTWLSSQSTNDAIVLATGAVVAPGLSVALDSGGNADPDRGAGMDNWQRSYRQRLALLQGIADSGQHVTLVSGDYHCWAKAKIVDIATGRVIATAVVTPPAYAPMRYVNELAASLAGSELVGNRFRITLEQSGDGSGFGCLQSAVGGALTVNFDVAQVADT